MRYAWYGERMPVITIVTRDFNTSTSRSKDSGHLLVLVNLMKMHRSQATDFSLCGELARTGSTGQMRRSNSNSRHTEYNRPQKRARICLTEAVSAHLVKRCTTFQPNNTSNCFVTHVHERVTQAPESMYDPLMPILVFKDILHWLCL